MKYVLNSHHYGNKIIPGDTLNTITQTIESIDYEMKMYGASELRKTLMNGFLQFGWVGPIRLDYDSKISITAQKNNVGLCLQLGNICRIYADMMKLQSLYLKKIIDSAIIVVPSKGTSKILCESNMVSYERVEKEFPIFSDIITVPLIVIGFME